MTTQPATVAAVDAELARLERRRQDWQAGKGTRFDVDHWAQIDALLDQRTILRARCELDTKRAALVA